MGKALPRILTTPTSAASSGGAFLERDQDLAALERALDDVRSSDEGSLVLLAGEAGVGKSELIRSFCGSLPASVRVLRGACEPLLTGRPLGPFLDVGETVGGEVRELLEQAARPHELAAGLMRELQAIAPTVLVLEDLHWADEATLDVLTLVGRRVQSIPYI
jgi:predicted ATPase